MSKLLYQNYKLSLTLNLNTIPTNCHINRDDLLILISEQFFTDIVDLTLKRFYIKFK